MYISILNIGSTKLLHKNKNKQEDKDAFDLQIIKRVGQSFYILTIMADKINIYLLFDIVYGNLLKYIAVTAKLF